jgi:thiamine-monophosphate kinase
MSEFKLIERIRNLFARQQQACRYPAVLGIGDDAAVLAVPADKHLLVTTDTLVSGVHFFAEDKPADIAVKALAVSLSDLAAMGAEPAWFFLAVTLPSQDPEWWDQFSQGLLEMATAAGIQLAGGDTTQGPLSVNITAMGLVQQGQALRRDGAKPGDLVLVSGQPGLAALALQQKLAGKIAHPQALLALQRPQPRLALGQTLLRLASACVDVSDGLAADLGHILVASDCGAEVYLDSLPQSAAFDGLDETQRWALQLSGGDDYELCFTAPPEHEQAVMNLQQKAGVAVHVIGRITAARGLKLLQPNGEEFSLGRSGYEHFAGARA